ncbi:MAG: tRNA (adenosine(37)-N6)-threonylcarbamoyltransferase complex dimerization subunit type 1 TsaB [Clostridiales bacterium]|nr:tRNA (adenosine(37)-N6)-threonylcarbamoyltransferase complex dimerization subunit type 1 TsaB [Clostridiales bacterium]
MKTLALETSAKSVSVAVTENGTLLAQAYQDRGLTHSVTLMPLLDGMLKTAGLTLDDMDIIAVAQGPGSFTGIRIGVSAAKGLAWAKALPCCGVSTLEAMAYGVTDFEGVVVGAMDARRQQVYNALFRTENGCVTRLCADRAVAMELVAEELAAIPEPKLIVGDGAVLLYDFLQKAGIGCRLTSPLHRQQSAAGVALAAEHLAAQGLTCSAQELQPVYLRLSQAERERLARGLSLTAE